jgi:cyclophilin family peptidyl-prolyl cis-trans isomerase
MKYIIRILLCSAAALAVVCCGGRKARKEAAAAAEKARLDSIAQAEMILKQKQAEITMAALEDEPVFDIVTNLGTIKVRLYSKTPKHRANFEKLALSGYYDGLLFHRVINGFMIQGGDPFTKDTSMVARYGQGGPDYTVPAEFVPEYRHKKGALAAARRGDAANPMRESSGSQFYLVQDERACAQLDGQYTVYGETVEGLDVIDKIARVATDRRDMPLNPVRILRIELDEVSKPAPADSTAAAPAPEK